MRKALVVVALSACVLAMATGCCKERTEVRVGDFTMAATRLVQVRNIDTASQSHVTRGVVGEYLLPESEAKGSKLEGGVKAAIDEAITRANGDMMINCVLYYVEDDCEDVVGYKVVGDVIQTMGVGQ